MSSSKIWFLSILLLASVARAAEPQPLLFQAWKESQVLDAQNQVLRVSARLNQIKVSKNNLAATSALPGGKVKNSDPVLAAEKDLKRSQESLQSAINLSFEDYVSVYVSTLQDQPEAVAKLADRMSRDELAEAFKALMRQPLRADARRNSALIGGLSSSKSNRSN